MSAALAQNLTKKLESLPASSPAVTKLINIIDDPKTTRLEVMHLLALDQVLFANAFKYANSAAMGNYRRMETLIDIVDILGFNVLKNIAVLTAMHNVCKNNQLWFDGIFIAQAAKKISLKLGRNKDFAENIFMAAMLQQYGVFAMAYLDEEKFNQINLRANYYERLEQEFELFGYHHLELSIMVLEKWSLPQKALDIVSNQEEKSRATLADYNKIIDLAHELLIFGPIDDEQDLDDFELKNQELLEEFGIKLSLELIDQISNEAQELMAI